MSAQKIQAALGLLQVDPENEQAWAEIAESVTSPEAHGGTDPRKPLLEAARQGYETRRMWDAVARVLELEATLHAGTPVEVAMQFELARVLDEECFESERAEGAYDRLLALRPGESTALAAKAHLRESRERAQEIVGRKLEEAQATTDLVARSHALFSAAEILHRFSSSEEDGLRALGLVEEALALSPKNERAAALLERMHLKAGRFEEAAKVLEIVATEGSTKAIRLAALLRMAHLFEHRLGSEGRATAAYERVLDLAPGQPDAMAFLSAFFSKNELWDHLIALYEDQLRGGGAKPGEEAGIIFQIAMVNWRMRADAEAAEPWFDRLRRLQPAHPAVLGFFRERGQTEEGRFRLLTVLSDAQRAMPDGPEKVALAAEIAELAELSANAQRAIEQYKTVLRDNPENEQARLALKRLYVQTEGWNALIELLRQELERAPQEDSLARASVLREIAAVYRDHIKSDTALVTVLSQLVQLDETDLSALRELVRTYEALGRFRDLLKYQSKLAHTLPEGPEKNELLRSVARRWFDQFSNVQNATAAYEALLAALPNDEEALSKLRELYLKRRAFDRLYSLYEREVATKEGEERLELVTEMAKLASERLDRGADAIRLYEEILAHDPSRVDILDPLERQAEREKDFETLARTLERRLALAADDSSRVALLQKVGHVYAEKIGDHAKAAEAFRGVLEIQPGHGRALRILRDSYLAGGDYDGLEALYASQSDWEGLAEVLSGAADRAQDPELKVALSFRAARVFVEELGSRERAFRSYERVLSVKSDDLRAATELVALYERDEKWARLPALYEILLAHADATEKASLFDKLIEITGKRLNDAASALSFAERAYQASPGEATLATFEEASRAARSFDAYIATIEGLLAKKGKKKPKAAEKRALQARLARLYEVELGKIDEAIATYRALVEAQPEDTDTVESLDRLLRASDRRDDLRWLFDLRERQTQDPDSKAELLTELAALEEDAFGEPARAKALYLRALEARPGHPSALSALERLLLAAEDAAGLAELLEGQREAIEGDARAHAELTLAELYLGPLDRPADALACASRALDLIPGDARAVACLASLLAVPETRAEAASLLEQEYAASGDASREAEALSVRLETTEDAEIRLELFTRLSDLHELKLHAPGDAFDLLSAALYEFPAELPLWDRAGELAFRTGRATELAVVYEAALKKELDGAVEIELSSQIARLYDEKLGNPEASVPHLERLLDHNGDDERAFARLKQILTSYERWADLEAVYAKAAEATHDPSRRVELFHDVALVCEEITNEPEKALRYYEQILEIDPLHEVATRGLDRLYPRLGQLPKLAASLERRIELGGASEIVSLKLRLAHLLVDQLAEPAQALAHLEDVLALEVQNPDARALLERLLGHADLQDRVAAALEPSYEASDDALGLVRVLTIRAEAVEDPESRADWLRRLATLRDERLHDDAGAFDAYAGLFPLDPNDDAVRERMIELGRKLGAHARLAKVLEEAASKTSSLDLTSEILLEVARLYEDFLGDAGRAEALYLRALELDPSQADLTLPAARELERLYTASARHAELAALLERMSTLEDDPATKREQLFRLAELYGGTLHDPSGARASLNAILELDPADDQALASLEELYERTGAFEDLVNILQARAELSLDPEQRRSLLRRRAQVLTSRIGDDDEAYAAWQGLYDELGPEREILDALATLHEKAERWDELIAIVEADLSLEEEPKTRLELFARLGELWHLRRGDYIEALESLRQALTLDPSHARSRAALISMLEAPEARREVALLLHPLYEADGDNARLLSMIEIQLESEDEPLGRLALFDQAVRLAEGPLSDPARAFDLAQRALRDAAEEASLLDWLARAEDLASRTARHRELVATLSEIVGDLLDEEAQLAVRLNLAELAEVRLEDLDLAREHYVRALDLRGDDARALAALDSLYERANDVPALLDILQRRIEATFDEEAQKALLHRKARLLRAAGDVEGAILAYEGILDVALDDAAMAALDELYAKAERWGDLVSLCERKLDIAKDDRAAIYVKIADIVHYRLFERDRAFDCIEEALRADGQNALAVAFLERLLEEAAEPEAQARAAELLEPIYVLRGDHLRIIEALRARLAASDDLYERRPLLLRLASLQEAQTEDPASAFDTLATLFREDLSDEEARSELERLAKVAGREVKLAEIYTAPLDDATLADDQVIKLATRAGQLYASFGDTDRALALYRQAFAVEPESPSLFEAIDSLLQGERRAAERAELHRNALEHRYEPALRVATLHALARIEQHDLGDLDKAVETYREILDVDAADARALDALTAIFRESKRFGDLSELYELRESSASSPEEASSYRLLLARLHRDDLDDPETALDWYARLVDDGPGDRSAITDLEAMARGAEHGPRAAEILRSFYERADDWRRLVALNGQRLALAETASEKAAILLETAKLWEERGNDLERALGALGHALECDPDDGATRAELSRIVEALSAWDDWVGIYEKALPASEDPLVKHEMLWALAKTHDEKRGDLRAALGCYLRLVELDEDDPSPLEPGDELALMLGDWQALANLVEKKARAAFDDAERVGLLLRLAGIRVDMLEEAEGAIAAYEQALELDAENVEIVDRLLALYEPKNDAARLVDLARRRIEIARPDEDDLRHALLLASATRYEDDLGDARAAIDCLHRALEIRPSDAKALSWLARLLRSEELFSDLHDVLKLEASLAENPAERGRIRNELAGLHLSYFDDPGAALEMYRLVLDELPIDEEAARGLMTLAESEEDLRATAIEALEPVLRASARWEMLVTALELRLAGESNPEERTRTRYAIAAVHDEQLARPGEALRLLSEAVSETPKDGALYAELERLAGKAEGAEGWQRYAETLDAQIADLLDPEVVRDLSMRLGVTYAERLGQPERAIAAFQRALDQAGDDAEILARLDELFARTGEGDELAKILERRVDLASHPSERADLLHRLGSLQTHRLGDFAAGLLTLDQALDAVPDHAGARETLEGLADDRDRFEPVAEILERIYRTQGDNDRLASLLERRVSFAGLPEERIQKRLDLARLLEDRAADTKRAQKVLEEALAEDPFDGAVLSEIERLAAVHDGWESAARALSTALEGREDADPRLSYEAWLKVASLYEDKVRDPALAEPAYERALAFDGENLDILRALERARRVEGREESLVETLRTIADLETDGPTKRELLREAKVIAAKLGDFALAEAVLRQLLRDDDADLWALEELCRLRDREGDSREVLSLLLRRADLVDDATSISLRHEAAKLAKAKLDDPEQAIQLLEGILDTDASDEEAGRALRDLYTAGGRDAELAKLLERLVTVARSSEERAELRLELAKVQAVRLASTTDAIETLRTILEEDPGHGPAVVELSSLYESEHRDQDLVNLLSSQIDLAKSRDDATTELSLTMRLAEMLDSRLGEKAKAIEAYQAVLTLDPSRRAALEALARLHRDGGENAKAAELLDALLDLTAGEARIAHALDLAALYGQLADDEGRRRSLERGLEVAPDHAEIRESLASVYEKTRDFEALAKLRAEDAERATSPGEKVRLYRAAAELRLNACRDAAGAAALLERAVEIAEDDRELLLLLCDAYSASGRGKDAAAVLEKIVASFAGRRTKDLANVHFRLSRAYLAEGDTSRALTELDQAFRIDPGSIPILKELGTLSLSAGDLERAQRTFRALLLQKLEPGSPISKGEVFYYLGEISQKLGDETRAVQMLERALENEASLEKARALLESLKK